MLAILLFLLGFYYRASNLLKLNFILPLLIIRPYLFSFDIRIILISLIVFLLIQKIIPNKSFLFYEKANFREVLFVLLWTITIYYILGFSHNKVTENSLLIPHILQLKWYVFWIILKKQSKFGFLVRFFLLVSMLIFDGRTEVFLLLFFLLLPLINKKNKKIYKYYGYGFVKEVPISTVFEDMDKEYIAELSENYVLNRLTEAEISTLELLDREPRYLSTFGKLPELFIPRYFWPEKGNFLPGVYYNSILNGVNETIFSKNLELGFIGIWWHNFGYYSFIYVCLILLITLLVRNLNTIFLLLFLPRLFADYNQVPGMLESLLMYFIIYLFYVSNTRNRQLSIS
jgi:hypothetical protein